MVSTDELIVVAVVLIEIIGGVWLAGLTYLMWRHHELRKKAKAAGAPDEEE